MEEELPDLIIKLLLRLSKVERRLGVLEMTLLGGVSEEERVDGEVHAQSEAF